LKKGTLLSSRILWTFIVSIGLHALLFLTLPKNSIENVYILKDPFIDIQLDEVPDPELSSSELPTEKEKEMEETTPSTPEQLAEPSSEELAEESLIDTSLQNSEPIPLEIHGTVGSSAPQGTGSIETLSDVGKLDNPDFKPYGNRKPPYPEVARQLGIEGYVRLQVLVGPRGRVEQVKILHTKGHPSFAESAKRTAEEWRFAPPHSMGTPVRIWYEQTIDFRLKE